jgi:hypothetical protein
MTFLAKNEGNSSSSSDEGKHIDPKYLIKDKVKIDAKHNTNLTHSKLDRVSSKGDSITNKISVSEYVSNYSEQSRNTDNDDKLVLKENK